jgi:twitching motility protein PilT
MDNKWHEMMMTLLQSMKEKGASDMHISAGMCPYMRINGTIVPSDLPQLSAEECKSLLFSLLTEDGQKAYYEQKALDFSLGKEGVGRFRVNIYQQRGTVASAIRLLPLDIRPLEKLGLPLEPIQQLCNLSHGLVLVCGSVGSGKTTTLASMIDYINKTRKCHIIAIEDPVEYVHKNIQSLIHQREIRRDTPNFVDALRYILREDPDIVIIGEMRDLETIVAALTIAETGHLVFATLHTGDTSESIRRIIDVFSTSEQSQVVSQLASTLCGVINQKLLPTIDDTDRVLSHEIMIVNHAIQNLIRENKVEQIYSLIQMGTNQGMKTFNQSYCELVQQGRISADAALNVSKRPKELMKLLEGKHA